MKTSVLSIAMLALAMTSHAGPFDGWTRKLEIKVDGYTGTNALTAFPVLVKLSTDTLGFYYEDFSSPTGGDLRFADGVSSNELVYEIDEWNPTGMSYVWVQVPVLTSNTVIHALWRNPAATDAPAYTTDGSTWTNGHIGVWHMKEPDNAPADSALQPSDNSGTSGHYGSFRLRDGRIGKGYDYTNDGRVDLGNKADLADLQHATLMCWYYKRSRGGGNWGTFFGRNDNNGGLRHRATEALYFRLSGNDYPVNSGLLDNGVWYFLAYTIDDVGDVAEAFVNGVSVSNATTASAWYNPDHIIGSGNRTDRAIDGIADELRASAVVRSADWIRATYLTTASNDTFATYGAVVELDRDPNLPLIRVLPATDIGATSATLNAYLVSTGVAPATVTVYWGPEDMGTNAVLWAQRAEFPGVRSPGSLVTNVGGLASGALYFFRYRAANAHGQAWSRAARSFATDGPPIAENTGETPMVAYAFLNGTVATNGSETAASVYWGPADGGTNVFAWENVNALRRSVSGAFAADTRPGVPWQSSLSGLDVNNPGMAGSSSEAGGVWTVSGSGNDIWNAADRFHFVSRPADGDFELYCRASDFTGGDNAWRKGGIMARESLEGGSRNVYIARTPVAGQNRITFQNRPTDGAVSVSTHVNGFTNSYYWLRLVRVDNTFSGHWADDVGGVPGAWSQMGADVTVDMSTEVHVGLAVTAHNDAQLTTVEFDGFAGDVPGMGTLTYGVPYYYRCYATNAFGARWADETETFVTAPPAGVGISNGAVSDVTPDSVTLNGLLNATGSVFDVSLLWGASDGGTDPLGWANTNAVGSYSNLDSVLLVETVSGLTQGTWYGAFLATNVATNLVASPSEPFQPLGWPAISNQPSQDISDSSATLRGFLAEGGEGEATVFWGSTDGLTDPSAWAGTNTVGSVAAPRSVRASAVNLLANGSYFTRWYVTNAVGADWADSSHVFKTAPPSVAVGDIAVQEGDGAAVARFSVTLSAASAVSVSFDFVTSNGTALAGSDYVATNGTLTVPAGQAVSSIGVTLVGDKQMETLFEDFALRLLNPVGCTLVVTQAVASIEDDDFDSIANSWSHRMKITFSGYTGSEMLAGFPALVKLGPSIPGFAYGQFASLTGDDLRFTDANTTQFLSHEVEAWDRNGTSYVWVRLPELSGDTTTVWAYWGNAEAPTLTEDETQTTWAEEYLGVYHLHAGPQDSTTNSNHGVDTGNPQRLPGIAGNGIDVAGGAHVDLQGGTRWDRIDNAHEDAFTLSAWVNPDGLGADQTVIGRFGGSFLVWLDVGGGLENYVVYDSGGPRTSEGNGAKALQNQWQHVVAAGDGVTLRIYVDGQPGTASGGDYNLEPSGSSISLGTNYGGDTGRALDGSLDEARIAATNRSLDWIAAEYRNVAEHATFQTYSPVEAIKSGTLLLVR